MAKQNTDTPSPEPVVPEVYEPEQIGLDRTRNDRRFTGAEAQMLDAERRTQAADERAMRFASEAERQALRESQVHTV